MTNYALNKIFLLQQTVRINKSRFVEAKRDDLMRAGLNESVVCFNVHPIEGNNEYQLITFVYEDETAINMVVKNDILRNYIRFIESVFEEVIQELEALRSPPLTVDWKKEGF